MALLEPNDLFQDRGVVKVTDGVEVIDVNANGSINVEIVGGSGVLPDTNLEGGGPVTVGTTPVEMDFTNTTNSIILKAADNNLGTLYVGKSNVTSTGANAVTYLLAGETLILKYNDSTNAVWVAASQAGQIVFKGASF